MRRFITALLAIMIGASLFAPSAMAKPADGVIRLTAPELRQAGFPKIPNTTAWGKGTAEIPIHHAALTEEVILTGKAPKFTKPGQILVMERFLPSNKKGSGNFQAMEITAVVGPNRTFSMPFTLGRVGRYGYRVGYLTDGNSPEFVGFQFQFRTTAS